MKVIKEKLTFHMPAGYAPDTITENIRKIVHKSGITNGQIAIQIGRSETFKIINRTLYVEPRQRIIFRDFCPVDHPQWEVFTSVIGE